MKNYDKSGDAKKTDDQEKKEPKSLDTKKDIDDPETKPERLKKKSKGGMKFGVAGIAVLFVCGLCTCSFGIFALIFRCFDLLRFS